MTPKLDKASRLVFLGSNPQPGTYWLIHTHTRPNGNVLKLTEADPATFLSGSGNTQQFPHGATVTGPFDTSWQATHYRAQMAREA